MRGKIGVSENTFFRVCYAVQSIVWNSLKITSSARTSWEFSDILRIVEHLQTTCSNRLILAHLFPMFSESVKKEHKEDIDEKTAHDGFFIT